MKITDGNWLIQPGLQPLFAQQVHRVERVQHAGREELLAWVAPRELNQRWQLLDTALFALRLWSPLPGVIGVGFTHHRGAPQPGPRHVLADEQHALDIHIDPQFASLRSGSLSVRLALQGEWSLSFWRHTAQGEERLSTVGPRHLGLVLDERQALPDGRPRPHTFARLSLGVGEQVYGFGERFSAFVKNGQSFDTWNRDGGTGSEQVYKALPMYLSSRGHAVLVDHPGQVEFEVATERVGQVQFSVPGGSLDFLVCDGGNPKASLERYTALTGRPALPPAWSFGLWLSTSFTTDYDETTVSRFVQGMAERSLPLSVLHFDCFWMKPFQWCDFEWNRDTFPDPQAMLARLKAGGLRISVWINPYLSQVSPLFDEAARQNFLLRRPDGSPWQWDRWQPGMGIIDFTHPGARAWYQSHLRRLLAEGVDTFKTDFGERIPTDVVWHDGADPGRMHNSYSRLFNEVVFDVLREHHGEGNALVFARSAAVGSQSLPVHWGGDCSATFESMAESLRGGLSLGLGGFGFWSHDIGGFEHVSDPTVYKRWCAFGLLSSHSRLHGNSSVRVPWAYDDEAVAVLRHFSHWKLRLMPTLWQTALQAHRQGTPMLRAMLLEFPESPGCRSLDRQYMLGEQLLVAPVMQADGQVDFFLPAGRWTHLFTGQERIAPAGGTWCHEQHDVFSLPLYVRAGSLLALSAAQHPTHPEPWPTQGLELRLYALDEGAQAELHLADATGKNQLHVTVTRIAQALEVQLTLLNQAVPPEAAPASLCLVCMNHPEHAWQLPRLQELTPGQPHRLRLSQGNS